MAVNKRLRYEILRRDNFACRYCGATAPEAKLTVDHVVPEALGGGDDPSNLVAACSDCNGGKSATPPDAALVEDVAQDALRWRRAMDVAYELAVRDYERRDAYCESFEKMWNNWTWEDSRGQRHTVELPSGWKQRIGELMVAGLGYHDMRDAIELTMTYKHVRDEFAYFVVVARGKLAAQQTVAQEVIRQGLV